MSDLWMPGAVRRPGPPWKVGYSFIGESGPKRGEVDHSAEGYWDGLYAALDGPALKSWTFTIGYDRFEQHYPLRTHCWHAGDVDDDGAVAANLDLVGKEFLGMAGEPLTPFQVEASMRVTRWCAQQEGYDTFSRYPDQAGWTLAEHRQVSDTPTACPSNRIPWGIFMPALEEEDMPTATERRQWAAVVALFQEAAAYAAQGLPVPSRLKNQLLYLLRA